ncbi:MAG: hypothetical protein ACI4WM_02790, partial [Erysipelotrichaceae bacterium]
EIIIKAKDKDKFVTELNSYSLFFYTDDKRFLMPDNNLFITSDYREADIVFDEKIIRLKPGETSNINYHLVKLEKGIYPNKEIEVLNYDDSVISLDGNTVTALKSGFSFIEAKIDGVSSMCYVIVEDDDSKFIGKVSLVSKFSYEQFFSEMNFGHSFLIFEAYNDNTVIPLKDYFLAFVPGEEYYETAKNKPEKLLYSNVNEKDMKAYADSLLVPVNDISSITLNRGDIVTLGQTSTSDSLTVSIDSVINSNMFKRYDFISLLTLDVREFLISLNNIVFSYIMDGLNNELANNGITEYGGHSLNYELHRQAEYMSFTPNSVLTIEVTENEFNAMMDFINSYQGYATATENCTTMAQEAFNIVSSAYPELEIPDQFIDSPAYLKYKLKQLGRLSIEDRYYSYAENVEIFMPDYAQ